MTSANTSLVLPQAYSWGTGSPVKISGRSTPSTFSSARERIGPRQAFSNSSSVIGRRPAQAA